jgi:hypothetical protein
MHQSTAAAARAQLGLQYQLLQLQGSQPLVLFVPAFWSGISCWQWKAEGDHVLQHLCMQVG